MDGRFRFFARFGLPGRFRLFGLVALATVAAVVGLWSGNAVRKTAVAAETDTPNQVTVIPGTGAPGTSASGTSSPGNATIDYRNAKPLPLPSADWPGPTNRPPTEPPPAEAGGSSSPGSRGSGEQHMKIVPPR